MSDYFQKKQDEAAARVRAIVALPMPEDDNVGVDGEFDPWAVFPALYGSYSSDFDECAIEVLTQLLSDGRNMRHDLGAEMLREMLCTSHLCDYGTSPRACFPTTQFREMLPALIEKWQAYSNLAWKRP